MFTEIVSPLAYNDGVWHHAAAVLRSGLVRIYVDGVLVAQDTTNPIISVRTSTQTIVGQVASNFAGDIDEVLVFSRALSDSEIAALASGSTSSLPYLGVTLSSGTSVTFTDPSCGLTHVATMSQGASSNTPKAAYAVTITEATGWVPRTTWFGLTVAVTPIPSNRKGDSSA